MSVHALLATQGGDSSLAHGHCCTGVASEVRMHSKGRIHIPLQFSGAIRFQRQLVFDGLLQELHYPCWFGPIILVWQSDFTGLISGLALLHKNRPCTTKVWKSLALLGSNDGLFLCTLNRLFVQGDGTFPQ